MQGIDSMGFQEATPVQEKAIPLILEGKDIIGSAQTGTGKTAAFLLPIIHKIALMPEHDDHIKAIVIVPTRELAVQIDQQLTGLSYFTSVSSLAIYGGSDGATFVREMQALKKGADIIIVTPGRFIAHLNLMYVVLNDFKYLVLDEADRMLDMGFHDDIMKIISFLPKKRQNLLFSATMPRRILDLANKILHDPVHISIAISRPAERVLQMAFIVYDKQKLALATHILTSKNLHSVIVFCSTKSSVKSLTRELKKAKLNVEEISSDLEQKQREKVLVDFRNRKINTLVATDVLSRGIDIEDIELILNYDVPNDGEDYIHRIGRTARAESRGVAITLVGENEQSTFAEIEKLLGKPVNKAKIPAQLGSGPEYQPGKRRSVNRKRSFDRKKRKF
jgi:superfamily II DNA/RNA helicase